MCLPNISAEERGKERVGFAGRAQSVTMERGDEGLSPDNQENMKGRSKLQNKKQPPKPENKIPTWTVWGQSIRPVAA